MGMFDDLIPAGEAPSGRPQITVTPRQRGPYADAISSVESGGRYDLQGPTTRTGDRAYGKYQVMGSNVGPWTREVLGQELTPDQFINSQEAQDAVFKAKFGKYVEKYGPEGAARAWFAGERGMNDPGRRDVLGTSVADYSRKFTSALPAEAMGFAEETSAPMPMAAKPAPAPSPANPAPPQNMFADLIPAGPPQEYGPPMPKVGQGEAMARGAASGATANFYDEIRGLMEAGGLNPNDPASMYALIKGIYGTATGDQKANQRYEEAVRRERGAAELARGQNPASSVIGEIGGAVALPIGGALRGATLPARMGRSAAVGAGYGALAGAGEGDGATDRLGRAATGGAAGMALGAVAPPVVEGALQAGRLIGGPIATAVRGAVNPELEASRRVATALERDALADPGAVSRLTPAEFGQSAQQGGPARIMDLGGDTTRSLARSAANTSPEGRGALNRTINDRFEGQGARITGWLEQTFHYPNAEAQQRAIEQTARTVNRSAYMRAYRDGSGGLWSPELERLAGSEAVAAAMQRAVKSSKDEAIVGGHGAMNPNITFTPDGRIQFPRRSMHGPQQPTGVPTYPDLQYWDTVRRELSDFAIRAGRGTSEARRLNNFSAAMNAELDRLVPSYQQARQGAAHFFGAENALEAGQNFVTQNFGLGETRRALAQMSATERQLFQDGFVSRFVETINRTGDRRNVLNQIAASDAARQKLNIALGPQRAQELEAGLRVEGIMDLSRGAVQGNSTTARQLTELGFAGGAGSLGAYGVYNQDPSQMTYAALVGMTSAALVGALLAGKRGIDQRVARHVAEMLVSNDPTRLLQGIRAIARNNRLMDNLRIADRRLSAIGAEQVPSPAIQSIAPSRAENDKPEIPGPPR